MNQSLRTVPNRLMGMLKSMATPLCFLLVWAGASQAQVSTSYTFAGSSGTYTEITGGTQLWGGFGATFDNSVSSAQTIPAFNFNGTVYNEMYVSSNGFITFGAAPSATNFTPISGNEAYDGAISAFGTDIENRTGLKRTRCAGRPSGTK
ncbi:MAG: hypothetical protein IPI07_03300 [Flavobacteriales bacterium]|nr:hypothetical protein [Flavobacteriales bacterium]